jgi:hypothetical protein
MPLDVCLKLSRGDERLLREALVVAENALRAAKGYVPTGYTGDEDMLQTARSISKLATSVAEEMETRQESNGQTNRKTGHR